MVIAAFLSLVIGVVLGMLGGGGAILTLPMLVYALGVEPKAAIATSLFVVGSTSVAGTLVNARAGVVEWRTGFGFGGAAMVGAFAGGRLARWVPASTLLLAFAVMMLVTAVAMLKGRAEPTVRGNRLALGRIVALGAGVGLLSGLVGAGGGFLIVPALVVFGRLAMDKAIATSLFVIALQSFAGFAGHLGHVSLDGRIVAVVTAASVVGTLVGVRAARRIPGHHLRRAFAGLVVGMGLFVVAKQTSLAVTVLTAAVTLAAVLYVVRLRPTPTTQARS